MVRARSQKVDLAIIVGLAVTVIGWGASVESRLAREAEALNLSNRIRSMEELILPLLIDWKTHKELKKWQQENIEKIKGEVDKSDIRSKPIAAFKLTDEEEIPAPVRHTVDSWARNVFKDHQVEKDKLTPVSDPLPDDKP